MTAPFSLSWGSSVYVKLTAKNPYGWSGTSSVGNGAIILTYPDTPLSWVVVLPPVGPTSISFSWAEGLKNGGAPVLDYVISVTQGTVYTVFASGIVYTNYTATGLTLG
jgi:hypothetical protein